MSREGVASRQGPPVLTSLLRRCVHPHGGCVNAELQQSEVPKCSRFFFIIATVTCPAQHTIPFFSPESLLYLQRERESRRGTEGKKRGGGERRTDTDSPCYLSDFRQLHVSTWREPAGVGKLVWMSKCVFAHVRLHTRVHARTHTHGRSARNLMARGRLTWPFLNGSFCINATAFPRHSFFPEFHLRRSPSPCPSSFLWGPELRTHPPSPQDLRARGDEQHN